MKRSVVYTHLFFDAPHSILSEQRLEVINVDPFKRRTAIVGLYFTMPAGEPGDDFDTLHYENYPLSAYKQLVIPYVPLGDIQHHQLLLSNEPKEPNASRNGSVKFDWSDYTIEMDVLITADLIPAEGTIKLRSSEIKVRSVHSKSERRYCSINYGVGLALKELFNRCVVPQYFDLEVRELTDHETKELADKQSNLESSPA